MRFSRVSKGSPKFAFSTSKNAICPAYPLVFRGFKPLSNLSNRDLQSRRDASFWFSVKATVFTDFGRGKNTEIKNLHFASTGDTFTLFKTRDFHENHFFEKITSRRDEMQVFNFGIFATTKISENAGLCRKPKTGVSPRRETHLHFSRPLKNRWYHSKPQQTNWRC